MWYTQNASCYQAIYPTPKTTIIPVDSNVTCNGPGEQRYSTLIIHLLLERSPAAYFIDYYLPSTLLVVMSWVNFYFAPDALPARTTLGTSTWLTFITLTHNTGSNRLPKVSYIKMLDYWFFGCTLFIFASLIEFAVVNTIYRSKREPIQVKDISAKSMLPAAVTVLATPAVSRKPSISNEFERSKRQSATSLAAPDITLIDYSDFQNGGSRVKKSSAPNLQELDADTDSNGSGGGGGFTKNFTRNNWGSSKRFSRIRKLSGKSLPDYGSLDVDKNNVINDGIVINNITKSANNDDSSVAISIPVPVCGEEVNCEGGFAARDLERKLHDELAASRRGSVASLPRSQLLSAPMNKFRAMTSQEIALWIDMKSRVFFPVLFLIFIAFYFFLAFSCKLFHNCIDENDNYGF